MRRALPSMTPTGVTVTGSAMVLAALGVAFGYLALSIAAAGAAAALVVGWLFTVKVPRLDAEREIEPVRVERGQPAMGLVQVRNPGRRRTRPCTAIEKLPTAELAIAIPGLRAGKSASVPYQLPTQRRGALTVGPLAITRSDPFGLWKARRVVGGATTLLVQPRVHSINPRPVGRAHHLEGPVSETAPRGTLTFHTLREYVLGDDIRRVHWPTTARTGTLMVREHVDTSQPSTVVVLDTRRDSYNGDAFEDAVDVAASIVAASQRRGFPIRFVTTMGDTHLVRAGQRGQGLADYLAGVQPSDTTSGASMQRAAIAALGGRDRDAMVVVAGNVDSADLAQVTQMARRFGNRALVTLRSPDADDHPTWPAGTHLDGATAEAALARWRTRKVAA
jgi:uncharacterized protein (DUF58 family)